MSNKERDGGWRYVLWILFCLVTLGTVWIVKETIARAIDQGIRRSKD